MTVPVHARGKDPKDSKIHSFRKKTETVGLKMDFQAASLRHLQAVSQHPETGHVRTGVNPVSDHDVSGRAVQRHHLFFRQLLRLL